MSKVSLYEPAMCCDTGVCGPGVDTELLRVSSIIQTLEKADGVEVERFNLTGNPAAFVENEKIGELLQSKGADILGAIHIPLAEIRDRVAELDKNVTTITYCNKGVTGNTAQNILLNEGFKEVYNLSGGNKNYQIIAQMLASN